MDRQHRLLEEHRDVTRRYFLQLGAAGVAGMGLAPLWVRGAENDPLLAEAIARLEYLTPEAKFAGGGRGNPPPHKLTAEERREAGLDRDTWQLEVVADPTSDVQIEHPLPKELGTALDWADLMALAEKHAVRYMKAMTCWLTLRRSVPSCEQAEDGPCGPSSARRSIQTAYASIPSLRLASILSVI